ncbi:MAG: nucleotidyltransferase domain-containing protein [bacterium]
MPVRSSNSSVLKWPDARTVDSAVRCWIEKILQTRQDILAIGYFGSYARGNWGVGSDLDLIIILKGSDKPFEKRSLDWDIEKLPVPVDIVIYTNEEWDSLRGGKFYNTIMQEAIWIYNSIS